ncbi:hypothetical protein [Pseudomonas syringae]|uniref:hypothetical protein n=1 Tax=Pseudomonas syringae TaxID=317 RepID=UPI000B06B859|nr:hypothetical protein [Pseudomonas syringae]
MTGLRRWQAQSFLADFPPFFSGFNRAPQLCDAAFCAFFGTATVLLQNLKPQIQYIQQNPLD